MTLLRACALLPDAVDPGRGRWPAVTHFHPPAAWGAGVQLGLVQRAKDGDGDVLGAGDAGDRGGCTVWQGSSSRMPIEPEGCGAGGSTPRVAGPAKVARSIGSAWLRRLLVNACHDEGRRLGRRRVEVALAPEHEPGIGEGFDRVLRRDELARGLPPPVGGGRTVIALRYYLDLSECRRVGCDGHGGGHLPQAASQAVSTLGAAMAADARGAGSRGRWA